MENSLSPLKQALIALDEMQARVDELERAKCEPIAIIGMGCRFPAGGRNPEAFWQALEAGIDGVQRIPAERWPINAINGEKLATRWAGLLESLDQFDANFFGISPREANHMDPQQRMVLEVAWEALEASGQTVHGLLGTKAGVFLGIMSADYGQVVRKADPLDMYSGIGNAPSVASGRLSYILGIEGPSMVVDTACSSSLVAVDLACQSLRSQDSDLALAGGVNAIIDPLGMAMTAEIQALSPDGRCKTFDAEANGFVRGEGCGIVVLKRLSDAERDGNPILAVIRGSVVNQDGRSTGLTAPNVLSQQTMLRRALEVAQLAPEDIGYVETHGTGTSLGDPIEFEALREVLGAPRADGSTCVLGALKTNVGHMEGAAGIGGLIKAVLCLQNEAIPRNLHFNTLNPRMSLEGTPFVIPTETIPWKSNGKLRYAGVSSFGISGTNAHVILEQAPRREEKTFREASSYLLPLTAKTPEALSSMAKAYAEWILHHDEPLHHVAYTASLRRSHLEHRLTVVGSTKEEISTMLGAFALGEKPLGVMTGKATHAAPKVVFVFPGQGSQWVGMGRQLFQEKPVFRDALSACDAAIRKEAGFSVIEELDKPQETSRIHETVVAQPALFAIEVALAVLLQSWGVVPAAVVGHSVGEIAAAHVAGMLDLEQAARLVSVRARVMQKATGHGKMVSASLTEDEAQKAIAGFEDRVGIAAINDPLSVVLSGDIESVDAVVQRLSAKNVQTRPLRVNYAFHSPQMDALAAEFVEALGDIVTKAGIIPMLSTVTGKRVTDQEIDTLYWRQNIRQTVRFAKTMAAIASTGDHAFVEVGPHPVLTISMEQTLSANNMDSKVIPTLRREKAERKQLLGAVGALHAHGCSIDWKQFYPDSGRVVDLPTYPWQRKRYWVEASAQSTSHSVPTEHPLLGNRITIAGVGAVFESTLDPKQLVWLNDHRVFGEVVVPGAALLEMARAAGAKHLGTDDCQVTGLTIQSPLRIGENERCRVQVVLGQKESGLDVCIYSQTAEASSDPLWTLHAQGTVQPLNGYSVPNLDLASMKERAHTQVNVADLYSRFSRSGLEYGPEFQGLHEVRRMGDEALSEIVLSESTTQEVAKYGLHPALLDVGLQSLAAAGESRDDTTYLPFEFGEANFFGPAPARAWVHARWHEASPKAETVTGSLSWMDETGRVFAVISNLRAKRANAKAMRRSWNGDAATATEHLYRLEWQPQSLPEGSLWPRGAWLVVGESSIVVEQIERHLALAKIESHRVSFEGAAQRISDLKAAGTTIAGILCSWDENGNDSIPNVAAQNTALALYMVQTLARASLSTRLFFVTHRAVSLGADEIVSMAQSPLWGFGRVVRNEHPEFGCKLVDVDDFTHESWPRELAATDDETDVVWRGGKRFVARLAMAGAPRGLRVPDGESYSLAIRAKGELSNLYLESTERRLPAPGEIEIAVHTSGLNFRDVLNALGMYPGDAGPMGGECAGIVVAVGDGTRGFAIGDRVMALAPGAFRSFATVDVRLVSRIPRGMTMAQAAAIPTVFLTAWYALHDLGHLQRGERILVHAAAGGVGMAAVQIAQHLGAHVFVTASPSKWDIVRKMGVEHIANSRTLEFAKQFGSVDVVLNSLAGEFVDASLSLLTPNGRFLEMGKTDVRSVEAIEAAYPGRQYQAFDLMEAGPDRIHEMFGEIVSGFETGVLSPLPVHGFAMTEAEAAFRYMARAQHIGKIVLRAAPRKTIATNSTVLVTGGLGALGLQVARWLWTEHHIAHIVLVGRSEPTAAKLSEIEQLRTGGANITVMCADVSNASTVRQIVESMPVDRPLCGIIHAAGALDDGMIVDQTPERFTKVFAPKVQGAWNLHEATRHLPLEFFVMFSSIASVLGGAAQSNYAAANAFLNALAQSRQTEGLPALSLQWGAWAEGGMAAALTEAMQVRLSRMGMGMLSPVQGLSLLGAAMKRDDGELVATLLDLTAMDRGFAQEPPVLWRSLMVRKGRTSAARRGKIDWRENLAGLDVAMRVAEVGEALRADVAKVLAFGSANDVPDERPLQEVGLDSLMAVELRNAISARLGQRLPATLLFDYPTVKALRQYLLEKVFAFDGAAVVATQPVKTSSPKNEPIAIVGLGCRFPGGVYDPEGFWRLLENEVDAIREVPKERWDIDAYYDANPDAAGKMTTRWGGFLDEVDRFEPAFFGVSPREAQSFDPQQRFLLETTWEALERAGISAERLMGSDTGVYVGICSNEYQQRTMANVDELDAYSLLGTAHSTIVGRISYWLGLQGPNMAINTACSSSLVSVHLACQALRAGECSMALAGGANLVLSPEGTVYFSRLKAMSPTGRCHTFSADADGYVRSEGCAMVVLKRLSDALRDGDSILALIRGTAINQDGRSQGLTAPNGPAQEAVIRKALSAAGVHAADIDYVEAHGTGTPLGDPIEVQALANVLGEGRDADKPVIIGSVKTNIGHTEGAAGIAGLVKAMLSLKHDTIPRSLHFTEPNSHIAWSELPVKVATERMPWLRNGKSRRAGISSFGFSGTNAHVILEEAPRREEKRFLQASSYLLPLSAKTPEALSALARSYAEWLTQHDEPLHHVAYSASVRRNHLEHRLGVAGSTREEIAAALAAFVSGEVSPSVVTGKAAQSSPEVVFVFPGQGSQWVGMGRQLYREELAFREALDKCDAAIRKEAGFSVIDELEKPQETSRLHETIVAQPALFAIEVALAVLLQSWGIAPAAVIGHSVGEIAAAHVAGILDLAQAARLVSGRARVMQKATGHGKMVSVSLTEDEAQKAIAGLEDRVGIAAINDPSSAVLSGDIEAIDTIVQRLSANDVQTRALRVNYAFHSPQMDPLLAEFMTMVGHIEDRPGTIPMLSTVTGKALGDARLDAAYWAQNIRQTVRFVDTIALISSKERRLFVEVGPHPVLTISMEQTLSANNVDGKVIPTLRREKAERKQLLGAVGALHVHGCSIDWKQFFPEGGRVVDLPTYPWQRKRYWIDAPSGELTKLKTARRERSQRNGQHHPLLGTPFSQSIPSIARFWQHAISTSAVPWLAAHVVQGEIVLPGTGYLECMLAAGLSNGGERPLVLEDVNFDRILAVGQDDEREFQVVMLEGNAPSAVQIASKSDADMAWAIHARGIVRETVSEFVPTVELPEEIPARLSHVLDGAAIYEQLWNRQLHLGLPFRGIVGLRASETEVLAQIRLPDGVDHREYVIHPALLDACFQASMGFGLLTSDAATYVPRRIERLHFYSRPLRNCWVLLTKQRDATNEGVLISEIRLMDEHGQPFVVIQGLHAHKLLQASRSPDDALEDCLHEVAWRGIDPLPEPNLQLNGKWLIFADCGGTAAALVGAMSLLGQSSVFVAAGPFYRKLESDRFEIDLAKPEDHQRLLQDVFGSDGQCRGVVFLPSLDAPQFDQTTPESLTTDLVHATVSAVHAVQALLRHGFGNVPQLFLVTRGAQSVLPGDPVSVAQSPILGLGKTISMEHPEIDCRNIDLSPYPSENDAVLLLRELGSERNEGPIALRGQSRHAARLVRGTWETPLGESVNIRPDRTYLLTGGLGGLGLSLATWLVERGARNLVLLGRNEPATNAMRAIEAMQYAGARVWTMKVDISRENDVNQLFKTIHEEMPPLGGVVHLAAVLKDRMLLDQSQESIEQVFAPKALGAWNLHQHCKGLALDFFVLYSSAAGLIGSPGQSNYSAANTFLDALARERVRLGLPATSIQWGAFSEVGMAAAQENRGNRIASRGMAGLTPAEGLEALRRILITQRTEVSVARLNVHQWSESYPSMRQSAFMAELFEKIPQRQDVVKSGRLGLRTALANARPEERLALVEQFLATELGHILQLEPTAILANSSMFELGLDSLMRVELRNRIGVGLGFEPSIVALSRYDDIAALAGHLLQHASLTESLNDGTAQLETTNAEVADEMESYTF